MTLVKRDARYTPVLSNLFNDLLTRELFNWPYSSATSTSIPKVNIYETNDEFHV